VARDVYIRSYVSIEALSTPDTVVLRFGDRVQIGHFVRFVALNGIEIENDAGIGHGSTIADTIHEWKGAEEDQGLWQTPLKVGRPMRIGTGAWIGNNCVVTGGITIGARAIVGPNCVITRDVPAETVIGGSPPRMLRRKTAEGWQWLVDPASLELDVRNAAEERQG
jgi:acetyltransferase-like isoleucine patch superfamily enzyme